jgi:preprotein translocase subunit SecG
MDKKSDRPCPGDDVHEKVLEQFHRLTADDGLLLQTVQYVKTSNSLARSNNVSLRRVNLILFTFMLLLALLLAMGWKSLQDVRAAHDRLESTTRQLDDVVSRLGQVQVNLDMVKKDTKNIKDEQQAQPKVELVPEPDPAKAKDAPIKVRITPAVPSGKEAPSPTVEVPLPVKDVVEKK